MFTAEYISHSESETEAIGERLASILTPGDVVLLEANLGGGKTVMSRGIARGLKITETISSPTFAIVQEYESVQFRFYHIDLYRLADIHDADSFGIEDYLKDPEAITVIEWPSRIKELIDPSMIQVKIHYCDAGRRIEIYSQKEVPE